jgi:hypothetical protein
MRVGVVRCSIDGPPPPSPPLKGEGSRRAARVVMQLGLAHVLEVLFHGVMVVVMVR